MSYSTRAAIILIISVGVVISYPSLMYPPMRRAAKRVFLVLSWPLRALWRVGLWIATPPIEWVRFQKEVPELAKAAGRREQQLTEAAGRMWLETQLYAHKPHLLIGNADRDHGALTVLHAKLRSKTFGSPVREDDWFREHEKAYARPTQDIWWQVDLWFAWVTWRLLALVFQATYALPRRVPRFKRRGYLWVRDLRQEWLSLTEQQAALRGLMEKIPERTKIYDRLESAKDLKRQERKERDELLRPLKGIEADFEGAKGYIKRLQVRRRYAPTKGSAVLSLESLLEKWAGRVEDIERAQAEGSNPELVMGGIRSLVKDMSLAGMYGTKVVRIERRAQQIQSLHRRLKRRFRGLRMPDEEIKAITIIMREVVPQLWVSALWDELGEALKTASEHMRIYESVILSRAWQLQAGTFDQLLGMVFDVRSRTTEQMRINPDMDADMKKAADGSEKLSPFAGRLREHDSDLSSRYAWRK